MGTPEGMAESEKVLPENFVPPPYPQLQATKHPLGRDPAFPLQPCWHCPTWERSARSLGAWQLSKSEKGEGEPGRKPAISFSFEKGETEVLKAHALN